VLLLLFPTHAAVGYLAGTQFRYPVAAVLAGAVVPDLVDRPLLWLGLASHSHTVGHSALVAVPAAALAWLYGPRGVGLAVGWLLHLAGDVVNVATTAGPTRALTFVLFPLVDPVGGQRLPTVAVSVPFISPHYVSPVVLVAELAVLVWALLVAVRQYRAGQETS
jgi:hypothetical protein